MGLQLIFCIETRSKKGSDWVYIAQTIDNYYQRDRAIKQSKVPMNGKMGMNSPKVKRKVDQLIREYKSNGESRIIYCVDTDDWKSDPEQQKDWQKIQAFCKNRGYDLVWFCRDIEEVFLGFRIDSSVKAEHAAQFRRGKGIQKIGSDRLSREIVKERYSNILLVLDQYLERKTIV